MESAVTSVARITYDNRTDLIEIIGNRQVGSVPSRISAVSYEIVNGSILGWGDYNAVIEVDFDYGDIGGYWLATINNPAD